MISIKQMAKDANLYNNFVMLHGNKYNVTGYAPLYDRMNRWTGLKIKGPSGTPYASHWFKFTFVYSPGEYGRLTPSMFVNTRIIHPNINPNSGMVCIESEGHGYQSPVAQLLALYEMLHQPNWDGPIDNRVTTLGRKEYDRLRHRSPTDADKIDRLEKHLGG